MRHSILLIILCLSFVTGCKTADIPDFPSEVKSVFYIDFEEVDGDAGPVLAPVCFSAELISTDPFRTANPIRLPNFLACRGLMGFHPKEMNRVFKWGDSVKDWAEQNCKK